MADRALALFERLKKFRLGDLIDIDTIIEDEDEEVLCKWEAIVEKLEVYAEHLPPRSEGPVTIARIIDQVGYDASKYTNLSLAWQNFKNFLHQDTDVDSSFLDAFRAYRASGVKSVSRSPPLRPTEPVERHGFIHVTDVDWEDTRDGARVFIYGRSMHNRNETVLLLTPLRDYFYIEVTDEWSSDKIIDAVMEKAHRMKSRYDTKGASGKWQHDRRRSSQFYGQASSCRLITNTEIIRDHRSIYGFQRNCGTFVKVYTASPTITGELVRELCPSLEKNPGVANTKWGRLRFFESSHDPISKFTTRHRFTPCGGLEYKGRSHPRASQLSTSTIQVDVVTQLTGVDCDGSPERPFHKPRNMYFDIECLSLNPKVFPTPDHCPVIQISYLVSDGTRQENILDQGVLCLKDTQTSKTKTHSFQLETQLLMQFAILLRQWQPDCLLGFNSNAFDMKYIVSRMKVLKIDFARELSRRLNHLVWYIEKKKKTNQQGSYVDLVYDTPGMTMHDLYVQLKKDVTLRLRSYSLSAICEHFLKNENKLEMRYSEIPKHYKTPEGRGVLADYCMQDTLLLIQLDSVASLGLKVEGMAKVLGTTLSNVLDRGVVFKILCKVKAYAEAHKFLLPTFMEHQRPRVETYPGAYVVDPSKGAHKDPVVVWDAASLYPSCMRCDNLSWDTISLDPADRERHSEQFVKKIDDWFVKKEVREGILVKMQTDLAQNRKDARTKQKQFEYGSDGYNVCESLQLSYKNVMNSSYGMLGAPLAPFPLVQIAKTITGRGREMLMLFAKFIEEHYNDVTGDSNKAEIVYGDSVSGDTPITVRRNGWEVMAVTADNLVKLVAGTADADADSLFRVQPQEEVGPAKEYCDLRDSPVKLEAWTEQGWTRVTNIMRHEYHKPLYTVQTRFSAVTVTEDHSLVRANATMDPITSKEVVVGETKLLCQSFLKHFDDGDAWSAAAAATAAAACSAASLASATSSADIFYDNRDIELVQLHALMVNCMIDPANPDLMAPWFTRTIHRNFTVPRNQGALVVEAIEDELHLRRHMSTHLTMVADASMLSLFGSLTNVANVLRRHHPATNFIIYPMKNCYEGGQLREVFLIQSSTPTPSLVARWARLVFSPYTGERWVHPALLVPFATSTMTYNALRIFKESCVNDIFLENSGYEYAQGVMMLNHMFVPFGELAALDAAPVLNVSVAPKTTKYVYDLTTENHHFQAGLGTIIVHNTDSIFVKLHKTSLEKAIEYGALIEKAFRETQLANLAPHNFEYEKTYHPLVLVEKKKYVGMLYETDPTKGRFKAMGIQLVRRDTAKLCHRAMQGFFDHAIRDNDTEAAVAFLKDIIQQLFMNQIPLRDMEITKKIAQEEYTNAPPHIKAWKRMVSERGEADAPTVGEHFSYVVEFREHKNVPMADCITDFQTASERWPDVRLDLDYYFDLCISSPLKRFLQYILGAKTSTAILKKENYARLTIDFGQDGKILKHIGMTKVRIVTRPPQPAITEKATSTANASLKQFFAPAKPADDDAELAAVEAAEAAVAARKTVVAANAPAPPTAAERRKAAKAKAAREQQKVDTFFKRKHSVI